MRHFFLHHRFSEDLDFFTDDPNAINLVRSGLEPLCQMMAVELEFTRTFNTFIEVFITSPDGERVKLDFAYDTPYRLRPTEFNDEYGIKIDNSLDIASNKLSALFSRAAEKDFVDIFFINRELVPFNELVPFARQKHVGMDDYWLAISLQRVRHIKLLPRMIKRVELSDLQTYFLALADTLMSAAQSDS